MHINALYSYIYAIRTHIHNNNNDNDIIQHNIMRNILHFV